jgi:hypothetical protein
MGRKGGNVPSRHIGKEFIRPTLAQILLMGTKGFQPTSVETGKENVPSGSLPRAGYGSPSVQIADFRISPVSRFVMKIMVWPSWRTALILELSGLGRKAQYYWINVSFTVEKSRLINSPDREPTAVATSADNRMPMKMMKRNLMKGSLL